MNMEIGAKIKSLRLANSVTKEELSQKLCVSSQAGWIYDSRLPAG